MPPLSAVNEITTMIEPIYIGNTSNASIEDEQQQPHQKPHQEQQPRPKHRRRSVGFADDCKVVQIPNQSPEEISSRWMSKDDFQKYKRECMVTVQQMMTMNYRGIKPNEDEWEMRGLENMSRAGALQLKSRRRYCTMIVLDEQADQKEEGVIDKDRMAKLYKAASNRCVQSAIAKGQKDAQVAAHRNTKMQLQR